MEEKVRTLIRGSNILKKIKVLQVRKRLYLSWIFKSFSDAAATADATSAHKIAIIKY